MSYCINPECKSPKNPLKARVCQSCGSSLFLNDRYKPLKSLGKGGFGATFLAVDLSLPGKPSCVIKQLRPSTNVPHLFEMARELFEREAKTLGRIGNHPQVPRLLDYFENNQQFYLVQEYVKGNNLQQEIKKNGVFSEAGTRQFLSEILPMVQYIHSQQVIHRDIKPANLIRREQDKKLVLIDFGAVKDRVNPEEAANTSDQTALTSFAVGTPGYAPPEQMAMRPVYASDIYAIGITCLYLLTGKSPKDIDYNPNTGEMMWESHVDISNSFASVMRKMLESSVKHRYQCAEDVLHALDMEPYMESLAQGLSSGTDSNFAGSTGGNFDNSNGDRSGSPSTSANSRLAMAIRARRDRRKGSNVRQSMGSRTGPNGTKKKNTLNRMAPGAGAQPHKSASRYKSKGKSSSTPVKLDAKGLINAYKKGRRDFGQQSLLSISLPQSNLSGCIFHQSRMMRANFQGSNLANADFGKANLSSANFRDANLGRAYFSYTNLTKADLRGADLSYAYLNYAIVDGANLCGANLKNAKITDEQLKKAKTNWATIMPNGKRGLF